MQSYAVLKTLVKAPAERSFDKITEQCTADHCRIIAGQMEMSQVVHASAAGAAMLAGRIVSGGGSDLLILLIVGTQKAFKRRRV